MRPSVAVGVVRAGSVLAVLLLCLVLPLPGSGTPRPAAAPGTNGVVPAASHVGLPFDRPGSSGIPYVQSTIDLHTMSVQAGNFVPGNGRLPYAVAYDPVHRLVFIGNEGTDFLTVVDGVNHTVVGYLPVATLGADSLLVAGHYLYVAGLNLYLVQVFDTNTRQLVANVSLGIGPLAFAYDTLRDRVVVTEDTRPWILTVISNTNFTVLGSVPIRQSPGAVAFDPVDDEFFVGDGGNNVGVLNGSTLQYITNLTMGYDPWAASWDPLNDHLFITGQQSDNITVINASINQVIGTIWTGGEINATALDPTGQWLYAASGERSNVTKVNATNITEHYAIPIGAGPAGLDYDIATGEGVTANFATNNLTFFNGTSGRIDLVVANGFTPQGIDYVPATDELYIGDSSGGHELVWNASRGTLTASVPLAGGPGPTVYDPTSAKVFVLRGPVGRVDEIDPRTHSVTRSWNVSAGAPSFAVDSAIGRLFVADVLNNSIDILDLSTGASLGSVPALTPSSIAYCPDAGLVYVVDGVAGTLVESLYPSNGTVRAIGAIGTLGQSIACDPFNGNVYVANQRTQNVSVLNGTTLRPVGSFLSGQGGTGLAYDPNNAELLESTAFDRNVTIFGTVNASTVATVAVGVGPGAAVFDPTNESFFVADYGSGTVSVLRPNTAPPTLVSVTLSPTLVYVYDNSTFSVNATVLSDYGVPCPPQVRFDWSTEPVGLALPSGTNSSSQTFTTGTRSGVGSIVLNATFRGSTVQGRAVLDVVGPAPIPLASASISPAAGTILVAANRSFHGSALLAGGAPAPPTSVYSWRLVPVTLATLNTTTGTDVAVTGATAGTGSLLLSVYYGGSYAYASIPLTVVGAPPTLVARVVLTPSAPRVPWNGTLTFTAIALDANGTNVTALATYHWELATPAHGSLVLAPSFQQSYLAGTGNGTDLVTVQASIGSSAASANATITRFAPPPSGPPPGTSAPSSLLTTLEDLPLWVWVLAAVLVVAAAVALVRSRRPPEPEPPLAPPTGEPTTPWDTVRGSVDTIDAPLPPLTVVEEPGSPEDTGENAPPTAD